MTRLPELACQGELSNGLPVALLEEYSPPLAGVHAIYPSRSIPAANTLKASFEIKQQAIRKPRLQGQAAAA